MDRDKLLLWTHKKCNNTRLEDKDDFSLVLDQLIEILERAGVQSESIGDLSQSFNSDTRVEINNLLSPYRKARFL